MTKKKPVNKDRITKLPEEESVLTIVGIGASAGGLDALKKFFKKIPRENGLAYVIIVHLSPDHESRLSEILQAHTTMPVQQVTKNIKIEPNNVYVIPPASNLNSIDTHLRLSELEEQRSQRAPIDHFFRTLAKTHNGNSIGVILTGTGSDGSLGIKEIKGRNGIVIVQDPNEAEFDGMPQSAISSGSYDMVLPLDQIPKKLLQAANTNPRVPIRELENARDLEKEQQKILHSIFSQVKSQTGRDFSRYKISTIMRRMRRRMQLFEVEELADYLDVIRKNPEEAKALADDFLITVTNFFRDPEVFDYLEKNVIHRLFENRGPEDNIRVWSVGCSTGEEAYSMAMMLLEVEQKTGGSPSIQVFASDLHQDSLTMAREGYYPGDIEVDISKERINRFFTKEDGGYRIKKEVRERIIFTPHNLLGDPPFSKLDLIICRNLLIYLKRDVQKDVFNLFHYALRSNGSLILGMSESVENSELFTVENKDISIFKKNNIAAPEPQLPVFPRSSHNKPSPITQINHEVPVSFGLIHQNLVEFYAAPSMLVGSEFNILHISKNAGIYLSYPGGEPTQNLFRLIRDEFKVEARTLMHQAKAKKEQVQSKPILVEIFNDVHSVVLNVKYSESSKSGNFYLILFEKHSDENEVENLQIERAEKDKQTTVVKDLQEELNVTRERLQGIIEEYETSQEEMKASNEELQSANEELRSTMEELETSKEELQSMNEELTTVNQENRHKVEELAQLSSDLQNLMTSTDIATLFLNNEFRILRFTPKLGELFNIRPADHGRPITDLTSKIGYDNLIEDSRKVLNKLIPIEHEAPDNEGNWYLTRILPYRSTSDHIEGVVITFIDITSRKQTEQALKDSEEQFRALIETSASIVWTASPKGKINEDSPSWRIFTGQTFNEYKGDGWLNAVHPDDRKSAEQEWKNSIEKEAPMDTEFRVYHQKSKKYRWNNVRAVPLQSDGNSIRGWIGMHIDCDDRKNAERKLQQNEQRLKKMVNVEGVGVIVYNLEGLIIDANETLLGMTGYSRDDIKAKKLHWFDLVPKEDKKLAAAQLKKLKSSVTASPYEKLLKRNDKTYSWMLTAGANLGDGTLLEYLIDISDRKKTEKDLKESRTHLLKTQSLLNMANQASNLGWGLLNFTTGNAEWDERSMVILDLKKKIISIDDWIDLIHPEDKTAVREHLNFCIDEKKPFNMEYRVVVNKGNVKHIHGTGAFEYDENDKVVHGTGLIRDITEQKRLQQHKDDFLRIASHELKTPVSVVKGYVNLLEEWAEESNHDNEVKLLKKTDKQVDKIVHLINDLLDVSKMETGKMEFEYTEVDFDQLVYEVVDEMQHISNHKIIVSGKTNKKLKADYERISQVLINLISNAIKYSPKAETININLDVKGKNVYTEVIDYGYGISQEERDKIFDRFYRVKKLGHKLKGLGLGLYISSEIIQRHKGHITVESAEGKGSKFSFTLPYL